MGQYALYDVLHSYQNIHQVVLKCVDDLDDAQLRWTPTGYSTSIAFHLWHLAREADYLKAAILERFPQIGSDFGEAAQLWHIEKLAEKWGFPDNVGVGTGIGDEAASALPFPPKDELLDYLRRTYATIEQFVAAFDARYADFVGVDDALRQTVERVRMNLLVFMLHDARHLGMIECLKGLITGFGSATEQRR